MNFEPRARSPIGWRRATRGIVVGVTLLAIVIAVIAGRSGSSAGQPTPSPLPTGCTLSTAAPTPITICQEH